MSDRLAFKMSQVASVQNSTYDDVVDNYRRAPFAQPTKAGKNTVIYNAHSYHTKVPYQGIIPYIEHYTEPGDLVLDPFCGSGMTGIAALFAGRQAILNDLSPAAIHIAHNYCTRADPVGLRTELRRILQAVADERDYLYRTTCDRCGGPASVQSTIWSDVLECNRCGAELTLWNLAVDQEAKKVRSEFTCPVCGIRHTKPGLVKLGTIPMVTNYSCFGCQPRRVGHPVTASEKLRLKEIEGQTIPYWYPTDEFPLGRQTRKIRQGTAKIARVDQLFTPRNLRTFACLWHESATCSDEAASDKLKFALTAIMGVGSRRNRWPQQQTISGTLYVPSYSMEMNVFEQFERRAEMVVEANEMLASTKTPVFTRVGSAADLGLPDNSVDYIFTDPPFGESLQYAELNFVWESWLRNFTNWPEDCVMNYVHGKDIAFYQRQMGQAFREMYRVLKPARWASIVFHNTQDDVWQAIQIAAEEAGFELASVMMFDKDQRTFNQVNIGKKGAAGFDIVLNLQKPRRHSMRNGVSKAENLEVMITEVLADFLATNPAPAYRTIQHLHSYVLRHILSENLVIEFSLKELQQILPHHFKEVDGRWYLRGEAVVAGSVFDLKTDTGAITWLSALLAEKPQTLGDLIPQWQAATAYLGTTDTGRLERVLRENFWLEPHGGCWRIPTEVQREKMSNRQALADEAHLRVVRRFLAGNADHRPNDWELSEWLRFCYRREAYNEAIELFQHIQGDGIEPERYKELKKIVAVCRMKTQAGA